jgi:uncharacterized cupredoxin-like copper-binding protein
MRRNAVILVAVVGVMAVVVGCSPKGSERAIPSSADRVVELSMTGMRFLPDHLNVHVGETIAFVVNNPNDIAHEVFIGDLDEQNAHEAMHMAAPSNQQAMVSHYGTGIFLDAHGTGVLTYHFATAGEIFIGCHLPGHWAAGMHADVTITP